MRTTSLLFVAAIVLLVSSLSMLSIQTLCPEVPTNVVVVAGIVIATGMISIIACSGALVHVLEVMANDIEYMRENQEDDDDE